MCLSPKELISNFRRQLARGVDSLAYFLPAQTTVLRACSLGNLGAQKFTKHDLNNQGFPAPAQLRTRTSELSSPCSGPPPSCHGVYLRVLAGSPRFSELFGRVSVP